MRFRAIPELTDEQVAWFWSKVDRSAGPDACWPWLASCVRGGYGGLRLRPFGSFLAHRVAYQLTYGDLSADLLVCHKCDNPPCCNPACLFQGTYLENIRDAVSKGRFVRSPATRALLSGRIVSLATRAAVSKGLKAYFASPAARAAEFERMSSPVVSVPIDWSVHSDAARAWFVARGKSRGVK